MTRTIRPHKGGRTARVPGGRIKQQTLDNIHAEMQRRGVSWADMIEEQWGSNDEAAANRIACAKQ